MESLLTALVGTGATFVAVDFLVDAAREVGANTIISRRALARRPFGVTGATIVAAASYVLSADNVDSGPMWFVIAAALVAICCIVGAGQQILNRDYPQPRRGDKHG